MSKQKHTLFILLTLLLAGTIMAFSPLSHSGPTQVQSIDNTDTIEVIVMPEFYGYEYALYNFRFSPTVESELDKFSNIKVKPFPTKALVGVAYQNVYDKKYCPPIIEKVDVDFLILTRFDKRLDSRQLDLDSTKVKWGYAIRIVNTATLEQRNSIHANELDNYIDIENHIKANITTLKKDIESFR